jgi:hypothetical protein
MKYNGVEYDNCIINESKYIFCNKIIIEGLEWCYTDKLGISWEFCARGDFHIDSSILIKNSMVENSNNVDYCIFEEKNQKLIFSVECEFLLEIKKYKLENIIDIGAFEFFWINGSQIRSKSGKCLHPVESPVILNNKISYYGYIETKNCLIRDDFTKNVKI